MAAFDEIALFIKSEHEVNAQRLSDVSDKMLDPGKVRFNIHDVANFAEAVALHDEISSCRAVVLARIAGSASEEDVLSELKIKSDRKLRRSDINPGSPLENIQSTFVLTFYQRLAGALEDAGVR